MSNYNEALESEKRALSVLVENRFYAQAEAAHAEPSLQNTDICNIMCILQQNRRFIKPCSKRKYRVRWMQIVAWL